MFTPTTVHGFFFFYVKPRKIPNLLLFFGRGQMTPLHSEYSLFLNVYVRFIWRPPLKNSGYATGPGHFFKEDFRVRTMKS